MSNSIRSTSYEKRVWVWWSGVIKWATICKATHWRWPESDETYIHTGTQSRCLCVLSWWSLASYWCCTRQLSQTTASSPSPAVYNWITKTPSFKPLSFLLMSSTKTLDLFISFFITSLPKIFLIWHTMPSDYVPSTNFQHVFVHLKDLQNLCGNIKRPSYHN